MAATALPSLPRRRAARRVRASSSRSAKTPWRYQSASTRSGAHLETPGPGFIVSDAGRTFTGRQPGVAVLQQQGLQPAGEWLA